LCLPIFKEDIRFFKQTTAMLPLSRKVSVFAEI